MEEEVIYDRIVSQPYVVERPPNGVQPHKAVKKLMGAKDYPSMAKGEVDAYWNKVNFHPEQLNFGIWDPHTWSFR